MLRNAERDGTGLRLLLLLVVGGGGCAHVGRGDGERGLEAVAHHAAAARRRGHGGGGGARVVDVQVLLGCRSGLAGSVILWPGGGYSNSTMG